MANWSDPESNCPHAAASNGRGMFCLHSYNIMLQYMWHQERYGTGPPENPQDANNSTGLQVL